VIGKGLSGEVAERFKAVVLKTTVRKHRGFESLPLLCLVGGRWVTAVARFLPVRPGVSAAEPIG
jgi:hypothetical protein